MVTCVCGKIAHPTQNLAEKHLDSLRDWGPASWRNTKRRKRLKVYQCSSGSWHVGHVTICERTNGIKRIAIPPNPNPKVYFVKYYKNEPRDPEPT